MPLRGFVSAMIAGVLGLIPAAAGSQATDDRALFDRWARIAEPIAGPPSSVGFYSAGCMQGAQPLPLDGNGYAVMRPSRHRYYGHPSLLGYLTQLADARHGDNGQLLLIGDIGPPRGGPMLTGHASHQNGLDADVWLTTRQTRPTTSERERQSALGYVANRKTLRPNWTAQQGALLAAAADNPQVDRIFVSPPIKRYMCRQYRGASWLYRLRGWWGHEDHFHVRLVCPSDSPLCTHQEGLNPADDGCGAELDWWFSAEADREWRRLSTSTEPRRFPTLPPECQSMAR